MIASEDEMINDDQPTEWASRAIDVQNEKRWTRPESVYLGLGSNLGDREANLSEARERIKKLGLEITNASSIYETEPVGYVEQGWFLNQVIEVAVNPRITFGDDEMAAIVQVASEYELDRISQFWIYELFLALQMIEREMGRVREIPNGPRTIDIDVLLYGDMEGFFIETRDSKDISNVRRGELPDLILPHPRMHLRRFVLELLCEIAPELEHPVLKKTCREMLAALDDRSTVRLYRTCEQRH